VRFRLKLQTCTCDAPNRNVRATSSAFGSRLVAALRPGHTTRAGSSHFFSRLATIFRYAGLASLAVCVATAQTSITIDGASSGSIFEGVGAISAGGASRLLRDYPEPYRSQILDFLFKPYFGASFQDLKVEIGGDENSSGGAEPTHMRTPTDENYNRGYEFWLMQQAKARRPDLTLSALEWGAPGWIGNNQFYSQDNINYLLNYITGARSAWNLPIDYVGIWNETDYDTTWIKALKTALQGAGMSTKIVAADQTSTSRWNIADSLAADPALRSAVDVIGAHYTVGAGNPQAKATGKPLWDTEDGYGAGDWDGKPQRGWPGAQYIAQVLLKNYPGGQITKTEFWAPVTSYYDLPFFKKSGLMLAQTPWSGNFSDTPGLWAVAHVTQFAQPGWRFIDSASGPIPGGIGNYITLKAPNGTDYSSIWETKGAAGPQTVTITTMNGLSPGVIHVWRSDASMQFVQDPDITPVGGSFSITLAPDSIYSLTTTTGQMKGSAPAPPSAPFPFPYYDSFDQYEVESTPRYFTDYVGAFETARCSGSRAGVCLRQAVTRSPIGWHSLANNAASTFIGDIGWTDYQESVDVLFEQAGSTAALFGRVNAIGFNSPYTYGYQLVFDTTGSWRLMATYNVLSAGTIAAPGLNTWHQMKLNFAGPLIQVVIDGITVASVNDSTFTAGLGGLGTSWNNVQFDNFLVDFLPGTRPVDVVPAVLSLSALQSQQFIASVTGSNSQVSWSIAPRAGAITSGGLYTAPAFIPAAQNVTVTATSLADSTKIGTAAIALTPVSVILSPAAVVLTGAQNQQFNAVVTGSSNTGISWTLSSSLGSLSASGLFSAPALPSTETVTVTATSNADSTKSGTATVTLNPPTPLVITQMPQNTTVGVGQITTFSLTATGTGLSYQWQLMPAGGSAFSAIPGANFSSYTVPPALASDTGTQFRCVVSNGLVTTTSDPALLSVPGIPLLLSAPASTLRNNFTGWVGTKITLGGNAVVVTALGRMCVPGNSSTHVVELVSAGTRVLVPGGSAQVNMAGCTPGQFRYASLVSPVALETNASYYLATQEVSGSDRWYDYGAVSTSSGIT
jgi:hypothetical protein